MGRRNRVIITFVILVAVVLGLYYFTDWFSKTTGYAPGEAEILRLARCLNEKGARMYGSETCPDCEKQKELFGEFFEKIDYYECVGFEGECGEISALPAWRINGNLHYGVIVLDKLSEISGCNIAKP